jgi:hypothetical protein
MYLILIILVLVPLFNEWRGACKILLLICLTIDKSETNEHQSKIEKNKNKEQKKKGGNDLLPVFLLRAITVFRCFKTSLFY